MNLFRKNKLKLLTVLAFGFLLFTLIFYKQSLFLEKFDTSYWQDRYEHSRHFIPLSQRGIGDDGVYRYGGYKLVNGEDPTRIVYDKPALGVFLIGLSIKLFGNPLYSGLFFGIGSVVIFYLLALRLLKEKIIAILATFIFSLSPLFFIHFYLSLLDVPQMFFILLNVFLFYEVVFSNSRVKYKLFLIFLSGLALGLSAQIKIPIFLPILFMLQGIFMIYKKRFKWGASYLFGIFISIVVSYSFYFFHGYSFLNFIKIQKYITTFYTGSTLPFHPHAIWQFLLTGKFPDVVNGVPMNISEWSLIIPIFTMLGLVFSVYILFSKNNLFWKGLSVYLFSILIIFTLISTYPRHFLIIFPFIMLAGFKLLETFIKRKFLLWLLSLMIIFSLMNALLFLNQKPKDELNKFYYNYGKFYFHDVYQESLGNNDKTKLGRDEFHESIYSIYRNAWIHSIEINELENNIGRFDTEGNVKAEFKYNTFFLGPYSEVKEIKLKKINNEWKVIWDWNLVFNGYSPEYRLNTERVVGKRGKIISAKGDILVEDKTGYLIEFNPSVGDGEDENELLDLLSDISLKGKYDIQNAYLENVPKGLYIPLITTYRELTNIELERLREFRGIRIKEFPSRIYYEGIDSSSIHNNYFDECCTRIYSSFNYHGKKNENNPEYNFDLNLKGQDGGKLLMVDKNAKIIKILINKESKDGQDVIY